MRSSLLALMALLMLVNAAAALEPAQREVTVVHGRMWDGFTYRETLVPSNADAVTLIGGRDSAITFVTTLEYYWPLSRQVYVDFERKRDVLEGELVVTGAGVEPVRLPLSSFSIAYPRGVVNGDGQLLWGDEAAESYAAYRQDEVRLAREMASARQALVAYERQRREAAPDGGKAVDTPVPPPLPEPSLRLVTAPQAGFRIALEPGQYRMVLHRNGESVPGTQRSLRVIETVGMDTLVADVIAEELWTRPLPVNTSDARIYVRPGSTFFVKLAYADVFRHEDYVAVVSPQTEPQAGRSIWVRRGVADVDRLVLQWDSSPPMPLVRQPLKVDQTRGASFGYVVRDATPEETSDLDAITVAVPSDPSITHGTLRAPERPDFSREVVVVQPRSAVFSLALALVPLLAGLYIGVLHRRGGALLKKRRGPV